MKKHVILLLFPLLLLVQSVSAVPYTWTQKANLPGTPRSGTTGFSINSKGYVLTGLTSAPITALNDLWQWNQATNIWTQKASLPDTGRYSASAFSIGTKGYIAVGWTWGPQLNLQELWEYNSTTNTWAQKANFAGTARYTCSSFVLSGIAYVGLGYVPLKNDLWAYNPTTNGWTQKANLPASARQSAAGFSINSKGYVACGSNGTALKELWQYDPISNGWVQKALFPGAARYALQAFVINGKGYVGGGQNGTTFYNDYYQFNPNTNIWTAVASLPAAGRAGSANFSINGRGYISCGNTSAAYLNELWEFGPPSLNVSATGTNVLCHGGNDGSVAVTSSGGTAPYSYNWSSGQTTAVISNLPAGIYTVTVTDVNGTTGTASSIVSEPTAITVSIILPGSVCKGQLVTLTALASGGTPPYSYSWDNGAFAGAVYTFTPSVSAYHTLIVVDANGCVSNLQSVFVQVIQLPSAPIVAENDGLACAPDSVKLSTNASAGLSYQWKFNGTVIGGATDSVFYAKTSGTYKVIVTNQNGCSKVSGNKIVTVSQVSAVITPSGTVSICAGSNILLTANSGGACLYQWRKSGVNINGATSSTYTASAAGTYKVNVIDSVTKCAALSAGTVVIVNCKMADRAHEALIFPNPSNCQFTLNKDKKWVGPMQISVSDISGRLIHDYPSTGVQFSFGEDLLPGIYFIRVSNSERWIDYKVVKTE